METFHDRRDAGARLAHQLDRFAQEPDLVVLGLPRGGVPVAYEIATRLAAPLDVLVVRKIGVPGHPELAMGAIASGGIRVINRYLMRDVGISQSEFDEVARIEQRELDRREALFRSRSPRIDLTGKTVILVDDGLATGSSMIAAIDAVRCKQPRQLIVAVPVAPPDACEMLEPRVDDLVCLVEPEPMFAVGIWYEDFSQTTDEEVRALLEEAARLCTPNGSKQLRSRSRPRASR